MDEHWTTYEVTDVKWILLVFFLGVLGITIEQPLLNGIGIIACFLGGTQLCFHGFILPKKLFIRIAFFYCLLFWFLAWAIYVVVYTSNPVFLMLSRAWIGLVLLGLAIFAASDKHLFFDLIDRE